MGRVVCIMVSLLYSRNCKLSLSLFLSLTLSLSLSLSVSYNLSRTQAFMRGGRRPGIHCLHMCLILIYFDVTFKHGLGLRDDVYKPHMKYIRGLNRTQLLDDGNSECAGSVEA